MKALYVFILFFSCLLCSRQSPAGIVIKKNLRGDTHRTVIRLPEISSNKNVYENAREIISCYKNRHVAPNDNSGWQGIASLACGAVALAMLIAGPYGVLFGLLLSLCAIILGALGLGKNKPHRGLAIAGLVVGIIALLILLFALAVLIALAQLV